MKKFISAVLAVFMLTAFCSCSGAPAAALVISGTEINEEIFAYYADKAASRPEDFGLKANPSAQDIKTAATEQCKKYAANNTAFRDMGISLSAAEKTSVAQNVNDLWVRFEEHYNKIGVSKQTLTKICTSEAYENKVFEVTYDTGTGDAQGEKKLKDYFYDNYVCFRLVCAYFTSADGKSRMPQQQINDIMADMELIRADSSKGIDAFTDSAQEKGYSVSDSVIVKKGSDGYPDGFYEDIRTQNAGTAKIIEYDECVFAVFKEELKGKGESVYAQYRSDCVDDLYYTDYEEKLNEYIAGLTVSEKTRVTDKVISRVTK